MAKLAIIATIKTKPGKRDEYIDYVRAHAKRCRATEPGTLGLEIFVPHEQPDTFILYELYASQDAFELHWNGASHQQVRKETADLQLDVTAVRCRPVE
jgi:quinol monooxygenase YgiN